MGSIPGPILTIKIDSSTMQGSLASAMQQVRSETARAAEASVAVWKSSAAKIRAEIALGISGEKEIAGQRQKLVQILDSEISGLRTRNELTTKQLSNLKAATLELERQQSFLKGAGGLTAGTGAFLGQLQQIGAQLSSRLVGSLGANFFGVAGGSLLGDSMKIPSGAGAALGGVAALAAGAAALTTLAIQGGKFAVELDNTARKLGLTVESTIRLRSATEALDLDFQNLAPGFRKFSKEITLALTGDFSGASKEAQHASALFKALGIDVKKAAEDPFYALQQLSRTLGALPDGAIKTATAGELFGKSAQQLLPILDKMPGALNATAKSSSDLARAMGTDVVKSAEELKAKLVNFKNESLALQIALGQNVIPQLVRFVSVINSIGDSLRLTFHKVDDVEDSVKAQLRAQQKQLTPEGLKRLDFFLTAQNQNSGLAGGLNSYLSDPQRAIDDFMKSKGGQAAGLFEAFNSAVQKTGAVSAESAAKLKELSQIIGNTGESSWKAHAEKLYEEFTRGVGGGSVGRMGRPGEIKSERPDELIQRYLQYGTVFKSQIPGPGVPDISMGLPGGAAGGLGGLIGPAGSLPQDALDKIKSVNDDRYNLTATTEQKIRDEYQKTFEYFKFIESQYPQFAGQIEDTLVKLKQNETKQIEDLGDGLSRKMKEQAGKLFDDLISGKTKGLGKRLSEDLLKIVLGPVKKAFEEQFAKIFDPLINGKPAAGGGAATSGTGAGSALDKIFKKFGIQTTFGSPPSLGGGSQSTQAGQVGIQTPQVHIQTGTIIIDSPTAGGGAGAPGGANGFGNFFGASGLFGGFGNFFGNLNPFGGANSFGPPIPGLPGGGSGSSGGIAAIFKAVSPAAQSAVMLGAGIASDNPEMIAFGAAGIARAGVSVLANAGTISAQAASGLSTALPGAALLGSGIARGGVSGGLEDLAGGTLAGAGIGMMIGGPIGAGIGAAVGAITGAAIGIFNGIFGGQAKAFEAQVKTDQFRQQYNAPGSENFSFAENGSISSTLGTGFNQLGSTFSKYKLPANTPFWANAIKGPLTWQQAVLLQQESGRINPNEPFQGFPTINPYTGQGPLAGLPSKNLVTPQVHVHLELPGYIDAGSAEQALAPHAAKLAQLVTNEFHSSSSGWGTRSRLANNMP